MTELYLFTFVNFVISIALCGVVGCRLNGLGSSPPVRTQVLYTMCMLSGVVSATQPWLGIWPKWPSIITTGTLLVYVIFTQQLPGKKDS